MNMTDWLARYQQPGAPEGATRGTHLREPLEPGDVWEDGKIGLRSGARWAAGPIWVTEQQAWAAAYYGWAVVSDEYGPCVTEIEDVPLYQIDRDVPGWSMDGRPAPAGDGSGNYYIEFPVKFGQRSDDITSFSFGQTPFWSKLSRRFPPK